jgi:superfamily I DNA and/or RNA helicase
MSKTNRDEAVFILNLLQHLYTNFASKNFKLFKDRIGVITPYKAQVRLIKDLIGNWLRSISNSIRLAEVIEVNTVDAF